MIIECVPGVIVASEPDRPGDDRCSEAPASHPSGSKQLEHRGGHTGVVNSKAFEVAGTTMDSPDPDDGKLYREDGTNSRARG